MVSLLTHTPNVLLAYLRDGEEGLEAIADDLHERAHVEPGGKFSKRRARYLPQSPFPPLLWPPRCGRCRFYEDGEPGEPGTCHIVGREDDRWGGEAIHPRGWCGFYMPPADEPAFAWVRERLVPDGASSVRGEYRPETAAQEPAGTDAAGDRDRDAVVAEEGRDD